MKQMNDNRVMNGTFGKLIVDGEKFGNVKNFEAKATLTWEPVDMSESLSPGQKYMGYEIAGTITLHKIDSTITKKYADGIKTGVFPDITIIAALEDPAAYGAERVEITGVTLDEVTLMKFENKAMTEEEVPFKAREYRFLDMI